MCIRDRESAVAVAEQHQVLEHAIGERAGVAHELRAQDRVVGLRALVERRERRARTVFFVTHHYHSRSGDWKTGTGWHTTSVPFPIRPLCLKPTTLDEFFVESSACAESER